MLHYRKTVRTTMFYDVIPVFSATYLVNIYCRPNSANFKGNSFLPLIYLQFITLPFLLYKLVKETGGDFSNNNNIKFSKNNNHHFSILELKKL